MFCSQNQKKFKDAVDCYNEVRNSCQPACLPWVHILDTECRIPDQVLSYAPDNKIALSRKELLSMKIQRLGL